MLDEALDDSQDSQEDDGSVIMSPSIKPKGRERIERFHLVDSLA